MFGIKEGVKLNGSRPEIWVAVLTALGVYIEYRYFLTVTSVTEGRHSRTSLHYAGQAVDLRTRHMKEHDKARVADEIRERLTEDFDVILEPTHIHIEYQPKGD